jgi:hypothetical protein
MSFYNFCLDFTKALIVKINNFAATNSPERAYKLFEEATAKKTARLECTSRAVSG